MNGNLNKEFWYLPKLPFKPESFFKNPLETTVLDVPLNQDVREVLVYRFKDKGRQLQSDNQCHFKLAFITTCFL